MFLEFAHTHIKIHTLSFITQYPTHNAQCVMPGWPSNHDACAMRCVHFELLNISNIRVESCAHIPKTKKLVRARESRAFSAHSEVPTTTTLFGAKLCWLWMRCHHQ